MRLCLLKLQLSEYHISGSKRIFHYFPLKLFITLQNDFTLTIELNVLELWNKMHSCKCT